jgi:DNA-directed RNA polymerase alpha subunit
MLLLRICPARPSLAEVPLADLSFLLGVINWGEKTSAEVQLDLAKLGLPKDCKATDAEVPPGKPSVEFRVEGGKLVVPVERHDFRLITIER